MEIKMRYEYAKSNVRRASTAPESKAETTATPKRSASISVTTVSVSNAQTLKELFLPA
jgi:hypothetical protein